MKAVVAVIVGITLFLGYRAAASASFFELHTVEVQGAERASAAQVEETVKRELIESGVWRADLEELSVKLGHLPWVRRAVVSRVLPDAIRVRIVEREPRGVVRTAAGRFRWVDEDAVLLGEMSSTDQMPPFFLRGLSEEDTDLARKENVERVRKFLELQRDAVAAGFADRISEINLADVRDVRAQLAGNDSQIEVRLGSQDTAKRLQNGLEVLDAQRSGSRGKYISYIDMSQGKRAVVGFVSGAHAAAASTESNREQTALASASSVNSVP
jgi:cell division septal protein FtsQ